jgi:hypothetical protein
MKLLPRPDWSRVRPQKNQEEQCIECFVGLAP